MLFGSPARLREVADRCGPVRLDDAHQQICGALDRAARRSQRPAARVAIPHRGTTFHISAWCPTLGCHGADGAVQLSLASRHGRWSGTAPSRGRAALRDCRDAARPLRVLDDDLRDRIVEEAKRDPGRDRGRGARARRCASGCSPTGLRARRDGASASSSRPTSSTRRVRLGAVVVHALRPRGPAARRARRRPRRTSCRVERPARDRPSHGRGAPRDDRRLRRVRAPGRRPRARRLPRDGLLDQRRAGADVRRLAARPLPARLGAARRLGRVHRARRAADGRADAALPRATATSSSRGRCRSSRSPRRAASATARTPART